VLFPIIGVRLHGWLDELVVLVYLAGALLLPLHGEARVIAFVGAAVHFLLTRLTAYPQGTIRIIPFRVHAYIELGEGLAVLAATVAFAWTQPVPARAFLAAMGASQLGAFAFSDYGQRAGAAPWR
jgi:hypothetical protein